MTSEERREARYHRRKARREENLRRRNEAVGTLEDVFSYRDMFRLGRTCCNGVRWKNSAQRFEMHLFSITARQRREILDGTWKPKPYVHFKIQERGKTRIIDAPHIHDRQVHKTFVRKVLEPLYMPSMIYDNGASQRNKGLHFSFQRLKALLRRLYKRYGPDGRIVLVDLSGYFPNAPQWALIERHHRLILDPELCAFADAIVGSFPGEKGAPLGVEPSQLEMVALPSDIDNYLRCQMSRDGTAHYMDDYHIDAEDKADGRAVLLEVAGMFQERGMRVNLNKSRVAPISKFKYCKATFIVTETGKVITHGNRDGMKRARRKIKLQCAKAAAGVTTWEATDQWFVTVLAYYENYNDHNRVLRLSRLYYAVKKKYREAQNGVHRDQAHEKGLPEWAGKSRVWDSMRGPRGRYYRP